MSLPDSESGRFARLQRCPSTNDRRRCVKLAGHLSGHLLGPDRLDSAEPERPAPQSRTQDGADKSCSVDGGNRPGAPSSRPKTCLVCIGWPGKPGAIFHFEELPVFETCAEHRANLATEYRRARITWTSTAGEPTEGVRPTAEGAQRPPSTGRGEAEPTALSDKACGQCGHVKRVHYFNGGPADTSCALRNCPCGRFTETNTDASITDNTKGRITQSHLTHSRISARVVLVVVAVGVGVALAATLRIVLRETRAARARRAWART